MQDSDDDKKEWMCVNKNCLYHSKNEDVVSHENDDGFVSTKIVYTTIILVMMILRMFVTPQPDKGKMSQ